MASESWLSGAITMADRVPSSIVTWLTFAGLSALATYFVGSSLHLTMSTFSPRNSSTTACTREPRCPTQAPTGSTFSCRDHTAILLRAPDSRACALISTTPSCNSGTSNSNSRRSRPGWLRETSTRGVLVVRFTSRM